MSDPDIVQPDPSVIDGISKAPFVRLPDPAIVFTRRAHRLKVLCANSRLASYLEFLAAISEAQNAILSKLSEARLPAPELVERARRFEMPPLDRNGMKDDVTLRDTCRRLFAALAPLSKPEAAEEALTRVRSFDNDALDSAIADVLAGSAPAHAVAAYVYVAAALQVHFARLAAQMKGDNLVPIGVRPLSRLRRTPRFIADSWLVWRGKRALRVLHALLDALERSAGEMPCVWIDQGCRLSGNRRPRRYDQGRNLRRVRKLYKSALPAQGHGPRSRRG